MTDNNILSMIGLVADLIGTLVLFENGLPSKLYNLKKTKEQIENEKTIQSRFPVGNRKDREDIHDERHQAKIKSYSILGLILLILGFIFQFLAQLPAFSVS